MSRFGLFVLWPNGRHIGDEIVELIGKDLDILDICAVSWTPELTARNYSRFFRTHLESPYAQALERDLGVGAALVISVRDRGKSPQPAAIAARIREATGAGDLLYAAATPARAAADFRLIFADDPAAIVPGPPDSGTIRAVRSDLAGSSGWPNVREMFAMLNCGAPYVVLRNFEGLDQMSFLPGHNDIDILTADYHETVALLGAESRLGVLPKWGGRFNVAIGGKSVICDLRFPEDGYYDQRWSDELLRTRQLDPAGFYTPDPDEYLDSLLYHAVVHKPSLRTDYEERLESMAGERQRPGWNASTISSGLLLLEGVLATRGYEITRPKDPTVFFNHRVRGSRLPYLWRVRDGLRRRLYRFMLRKIRFPVHLSLAAARDRGALISKRKPTLRQGPTS